MLFFFILLLRHMVIQDLHFFWEKSFSSLCQKASLSVCVLCWLTITLPFELNLDNSVILSIFFPDVFLGEEGRSGFLHVTDYKPARRKILSFAVSL